MLQAIKDLFPRIFCIEDIQCSTDAAGQINCRAMLYHDHVSVTVAFDCVAFPHQFDCGEFVSVCWLTDMHSDHGAIRVAGLNALNDATKNPSLKNFNPFLAVPRTWDIDRHLIDFARDLWAVSSQVKRQRIFAAVFTQVAQRNLLRCG